MEVTESFLLSALDLLKKEIFSVLHVAMPGKIVSYDVLTGLADVQPSFMRKDGAGKPLLAPILQSVPVLRPAQDLIPAPDAPCVLIFSDFSLDAYQTTSDPVLPTSPRSHDLSDAIALVGYFGGEASL